MKNIPENSLIARLSRSKKLRRGTGALLFTLLVVLCAVAATLLADDIESRHAFSLDLSFNEQTVQSTVTNSMLSKLDKDVHVYMLTSGTSEYDTLYNEADTLRTLLERYSAKSTRFTYSVERLIDNPTLASRYSDAFGQVQVSNDCLIVYCLQTDRARVLDASSYYVYSYDPSGNIGITAYQHEKVLTQAVLTVTADHLSVAQIVTGHGEVASSSLSILESKLQDANYSVRYISLQDETPPDPASPVFILSPKYDYTPDELRVLNAFAAEGGDFFITYDITPSSSSMPNFNSFLLAWGISPLDGVVVADAGTEGYMQVGTQEESRLYILPSLVKSDITSTLLAAGEDRYLQITVRAFQAEALQDNSVSIQPILVTDRAYVRKFDDGVESLQLQPGEKYGNLNTALFSTRITETGERSHLFIAGSSAMFTENWMYENTSSAPLLLQMSQYMTNRTNTDLDILPKSAIRQSMTFHSMTLPLVLVFLLPILTFIAALVILLPRKHL